ncbi:MrcB family domain-containing protein [Agromyces sp. NPDC055661]
MNRTITEILQLQLQYTDRDTTAMKRRGEVVRNVMPAILRDWGVRPVDDGGWVPFDAAVQGKDGIGRKSQVPWVRIHSVQLSPSSTTGWYVVYLFAGDGSAVYLTLMHASTNPDHGELIPRTLGELAEHVRWGERIIGGWMEDTPRLVRSIVLHAPRSKVAEAYEASTLCAFRYPVHGIPPEHELLGDLREMIIALTRIYEHVPR